MAHAVTLKAQRELGNESEVPAREFADRQKRERQITQKL
jgi:hypothetical protein